MVFGIIGIFVALGFLFFLVFKGWSTTIATVLATIVVCIFTWTNPVPALVDTYSSGVGSSAITSSCCLACQAFMLKLSTPLAPVRHLHARW